MWMKIKIGIKSNLDEFRRDLDEFRQDLDEYRQRWLCKSSLSIAHIFVQTIVLIFC